MENNIIISDKYAGYLWYSDSEEPMIYIYDGNSAPNQEGKPIFPLDVITKNFVVEGYLFDNLENISHAIKYVDGKYIHKEFKVTFPNNSDIKNFRIDDREICCSEVCYLPHRINKSDVEGLRFLQLWEKKPDSLCEGMEVLTPTSRIFIGFKTK